MATWLVLCTQLAACNDTGSDRGEFGPLGVVATSSGNEALAVGSLMITDICVLLVTADREEALVWGADRTTWNEDTGTILFTRFEGETIELVDGQEVMFGGGGLSVAEDPDFDGILAGIDWVSEPDPTCARESWWFVGDVVP